MFIKRFGSYHFLATCSAIVPMMFAGGAVAQTASTTNAATEQAAGPAENEGILDIVVTAQRRSESAQRVPIAISPVSPQALATAGAANTFDLARVTPGLTLPPTVANLYFIPFIRGVGSNSPAVGIDSSVAFYIDGVYQSDKASSVLDFADIERIEVLKGPQGTLFGRNASGGAINVITLQPKGSFSANGEISYERFDRLALKGYVTGPITDTLSASLAYNHIGGGKYLTNTGPEKPGKFGYVNSDSVSGKVRFEPNAQFELTAGLSYSKRRTDDLGSNLYPAPGTTPVGVLLGGVADYDLYEYSGSPNIFETETYRATVKARYSLDSFDIVSLTGYVHADNLQNLDYDGTTANALYFNSYHGARDFSQEFQLLSNDSASPVQWVVGAYYFKGKAVEPYLRLKQGTLYTDTVDNPGAFPAGGSITTISSRGPTRALAAYGQATYAVSDNTRITAGLRYTSEKRKLSFEVTGVGQIAPGFYSPTPVVLVTDDGQRRASFDKITWRLALDHDLARDVMAYISWNRGFKSGAFNLSDTTPDQEAVKPEVIDAFEIGLKSQFLDRRVQVNAAAFYYKNKNLQVNTITSGGGGTSVNLVQNAASEDVYGLDLDVIVQPVRDLRLSFSGNLLDAKYDKYLGAAAYLQDAFGNGLLTSVDASGTRGVNAPKWSFTVGAGYTAHLGDGSRMEFNTSYFRTASMKVGIGASDFVKEYDSLGASITYVTPSDHFYVRVFGNNLTDRRVLGINMSALKASRQVIKPITYGAAVGFRF